MAQDQHARTVRDKIERLRRRLEGPVDAQALVGVLKGILDLLADEL